MEKYKMHQFLPEHQEVHWFSIVNSIVTVLLLTGLLATILVRVLRKDFIKFTVEDEGQTRIARVVVVDDEEDSGWKYVHGDVFRFPGHTSLLCALIGTGYQLLTLAACIFALALVGVFHPYSRGALYTALVVLYALTAVVAGFAAGKYYRQMDGDQWVRNIMLTNCVFCGPLFLVFYFNNTVAISYRSTAALPFGTIVILMLLIWACFTVPLTIIGGVMGKNRRQGFYAPCRTNKYPRIVPSLSWYRSTLPQMAMAGFLPFSAIYVELFYIFRSLWGHKVYTVYPILAIVFCLLLIVTAFITVALTYFQLAAEDHHWWWRSYLCGGAVGFWIYGYCFYFYLTKSTMSGFMQASFYFGYSLIICLACFIMLGAVGFRASLLFVRAIFKTVKCE